MIHLWVPPIEAAASERWWTVSPPDMFRLIRDNGKGVMRMLTIEGLIAVISLCVGCFSLGYVFGRKNDR